MKYLGDGLYGRRDSDGTVTLSTQRAEGEHYVVLEPQVLTVLEAWLHGAASPSSDAGDAGDEFKNVVAERDRLRAWLRKACNELDTVGSEHAKEWAAAIREETGIG